MSEEIRLHCTLYVNETTAATIRRLCAERNTTRTGLVLQALGMLHVAHDAAKTGQHIGLVKDRDKLDTLLVAPI